jgi:hypothetical protein
MMTPEQSEQAAESLLDQPKAELRARQEKRANIASAERRRLESPFIPAVVAAVTTIAALGYLENTFICLLVGAMVGGLFGLAARRD